MTRDTTDATFESDVLERSHERPVVVDFWAGWCGPCRALAPVLEAAVANRAGAVELVKVDVDANRELADRYQIRGIPAVKAFRNGEPVAEFVGAQPPQAVDQFLDRLTAPPARERLAAELAARPGYQVIAEALDDGGYEQAFELLLARLAAEPDERETVRTAMVALFADLGDEHPLTRRYRRQLASVLY